MEDFEHSVVQFVLQDSNQIAFYSRTSFRDAVHFELNAIFSAQQMLLRLVLLATIKRQTAQAHLISSDTFSFAKGVTTPLQVDPLQVDAVFI
jgi:hypothetical protein